jgi:hypothetical protein
MYGGSGFGWIWFVWIGLVLVMFSSFGISTSGMPAAKSHTTNTGG